jgi:hypothetical protein
MSSIILLVFEGEETEPSIFKSIEHCFFRKTKNVILRASFKAEIFQLWSKIKDDPYLDIVELLKERNNPNIKDLYRRNVSEIHLFFDHDAHSHQNFVSPIEYYTIIHRMLDTFCDEYDHGKLWISYPMVEALLHCRKDTNVCFRDSLIYIPENAKYKTYVKSQSDYLKLKRIHKKDWWYLIAINLQRALCLITDEYLPINDYHTIKPYFENNTNIRLDINDSEFFKFIIAKNEVVAISTIPLFILYYFGENLFGAISSLNITKNCSFYCYW